MPRNSHIKPVRIEPRQSGLRNNVSVEKKKWGQPDLLARTVPAIVIEEGDGNVQSLSRDPSDPVAERGRQIPAYVEMDEKDMVEWLALRGVEVAQHEQMVQAHNGEVDDPFQQEMGLGME